MVQIIGYVALAIGFITVIVSNIIVANKKKKQLMETQNNREQEFDESKYTENVLTYTFVKLKKDYDKVPTNRFFQIFFDALQTFPEDSKPSLRIRLWDSCFRSPHGQCGTASGRRHTSGRVPGSHRACILPDASRRSLCWRC